MTAPRRGAMAATSMKDHDGDGESLGREPVGAERRAAERFDTEWSVDCVSEDTFLYASITNISLMGIFVATDRPFSVGAMVNLRFAPHGQEPFALPGRVQWVNKSSALRRSKQEGMGIVFVDLSPEDRERLVDVVHTIAYVRDPSN